jgi:hypothetical protein
MKNGQIGWKFGDKKIFGQWIFRLKLAFLKKIAIWLYLAS